MCIQKIDNNSSVDRAFNPSLGGPVPSQTKDFKLEMPYQMLYI